jgi:putative ABC transport system ATP-binding protein
MSDERAIHIRDLSFSWPGAKAPLLEIRALALPQRSSLFVAGPSGSGKSTLLNLIAGVQTGYQGSISVCGQDLSALSQRQRDRWRADHIGLVFQQFNLLPWLSPLENVVLGCGFSDIRKRRAVERDGSVEAQARRLLDELGLGELSETQRDTVTLSIGQQQRVAAARALIGNPPLIIADEPTSALDRDNSARFIALLKRECESNGSALLFVSHDTELAAQFDAEHRFASLYQSTEIQRC